MLVVLVSVWLARFSSAVCGCWSGEGTSHHHHSVGCAQDLRWCVHCVRSVIAQVLFPGSTAIAPCCCLFPLLALWLSEYSLNSWIMSLSFSYPRPPKSSQPTSNRTQSTYCGLKWWARLSLQPPLLVLFPHASPHSLHTQPQGLCTCYFTPQNSP